MDERDVVELRLRLPAGELGTLARLMEVISCLMSAVSLISLFQEMDWR